MKTLQIFLLSAFLFFGGGSGSATAMEETAWPLSPEVSIRDLDALTPEMVSYPFHQGWCTLTEHESKLFRCEMWTVKDASEGPFYLLVWDNDTGVVMAIVNDAKHPEYDPDNPRLTITQLLNYSKGTVDAESI